MKFQAIKGVRDILPPESALWNRVEQTSREVFRTFGFAEIRVPILESTEVFARSIGLNTDVVSKEMYTFEDHDVRDLEFLRHELIRTIDQNPAPGLAQFIVGGLHQMVTSAKVEIGKGNLSRTPEIVAAMHRFEEDMVFLVRCSTHAIEPSFFIPRSRGQIDARSITVGY